MWRASRASRAVARPLGGGNVSERTSLFLPTCLPAATGRLFATSLTRGALMPIVSLFSLASLPLSPAVVIAGGAVWGPVGGNVRYSHHALRRMRKRSISATEVEETLRHYETAVPARSGATNYCKVIGSRRIRVTVAPDDITIKTVTEETL